ncbi:MAG: AMP-binding protein [Butyrivibrio sp.]|nr:AMP-binding protein [Butyrivibrio sp.]
MKYTDIPALKWTAGPNIMQVTYGSLFENVAKIRKSLSADGFNGSHLALIGTSSISWMESYLAITSGNNVAIPLDPLLPSDDLIDLVKRSDSKGVFIEESNMILAEKILAQCPKVNKIYLLNDFDSKKKAYSDPKLHSISEHEFSAYSTVSNTASHSTSSDINSHLANSSINCDIEDSSKVTDSRISNEISENHHHRISSIKTLKELSDYADDVPGNEGDDTAMIIFTSGTTGKSKGVMLSQKALISNVESVEYDVEPGKTLLSVLPVHHAFCLVMDYLKGFSLGTTICINDSFLHMAKNMTLFKPEVMLMVPMMVETIYKKLESVSKLLPKKMVAQKVFGGNLKTIFVGGAHLDEYYIDKFAAYGIDLYEGYGMSECSPVISSNNPTTHKPGSVGKVLKNAQVSFEDGEVLVRSTSVMKGYYKMPQETAETLKDGWLHTGDKGYLDEDGFLYINGRVKNLIILSNGENISPEEIENKLALHKLIDEVVITGEDNILTARIYPNQDIVNKKKWDEDTVRSELQKVLDDFNRSQPTYRKISRLVVRQNPFARNTTRKILRQKALLDEPA